MPDDKVGRVLGNQILRSGTSVAANYRSACKARSKADFISKITIVEEEADETTLWLESIMESDTLNNDSTKLLHKESNELTQSLPARARQQKRTNTRRSKINAEVGMPIAEYKFSTLIIPHLTLRRPHPRKLSHSTFRTPHSCNLRTFGVINYTYV